MDGSAPVATEELSVPSSSSLKTRHRGESNVSFSSVATNIEQVSAKRQEEFERYFANEIRRQYVGPPPDDLLTVIATQSGDLQAKLLLHGRLYLTPHHLCFRSNILGYKTETIHPLDRLTSVKKGTTAKWIQNAVYIIEDSHEAGDYIGYGSLADRDAMFANIVEQWKTKSPNRHSAWLERGSSEALVEPEEEIKDAAVLDEDLPVSTTECSGKDHLSEVALDTIVAMPLEKLYELVYQNQEFIEDFYTNDKGLTDLKISGWTNDEAGQSMRTLTYVMHMNNPVGPSKSDCNGSETVVASIPDKCYEILSETQTPDVPSGSKFKIHTRTCLTQASLKDKPATRMFCTTQCDWSSGSWLKGTITPAVIKGQKEHHQQLLAKIHKYITAHPDEFDQVSDEEDDRASILSVDLPREKTYIEHAQEIPENPVMLGLLGFLLALMISHWIGFW